MSDGSELTFSDYNLNSLAVRGDKDSYHEIVKAMGGRWNSRMRGGAGWLVPKRNQQQLENFIKMLNEPDHTAEIVPKSRKEQKKYHREESESEYETDGSVRSQKSEPEKSSPSKEEEPELDEEPSSEKCQDGSSSDESDESSSSSEEDSSDEESSDEELKEELRLKEVARKEAERKEKERLEAERKETERKEAERKAKKAAKKAAKREKIMAEIARLEAEKAKRKAKEEKKKKKKEKKQDSPDPIQYYKSFNKKPKDFKKLYESSSEDEIYSSSSAAESSDNFPSPEVPKKRKHKKHTPKKQDYNDLLDKFNETSRRLHEMEIQNRKLRAGRR